MDFHCRLKLLIIVLQGHQLQGCHSLTRSAYHTSDDIHSSHRMAFVESMHGWYYYTQTQPMANTRSNRLVDS